MESVSLIYILYETTGISLCTNALRKGTCPSLQLQAMGKLVDKTVE